MSEFIGYITRIETKSGTSKNGKPYTVYNVTATGKSGEEIRVGWGFDAPSFQEGVWVKTTLVQNGNYLNYKGAPVEIAPGPAPAASTSAPGNQSTGSSGGNDRQASIVYQSSRKDAIHLVDILERSGSLPVSSAKGKAGEAKRYEQIHEIVDKITVQFYHDVETLRLLDTVADAGDVDVAARGELPPEVEAPAEAEAPAQEDDFNDDIPF